MQICMINAHLRISVAQKLQASVNFQDRTSIVNRNDGDDKLLNTDITYSTVKPLVWLVGWFLEF